MKKIVLFAISFLLISGSAFSGPIPELLPIDSKALPPAIEPEFPPQPEQQLPPEVSMTSPTMNIEAIQHLSGVVYYTLMRDWGLTPPRSDVHIQAHTYSAVEALAPASSVYGTVNMTSDSNQDVEPTVMAYNNNGTVYISTVYIKYLADGSPRNYFSMTPDQGVTFYRGQLVTGKIRKETAAKSRALQRRWSKGVLPWHGLKSSLNMVRMRNGIISARYATTVAQKAIIQRTYQASMARFMI